MIYVILVMNPWVYEHSNTPRRVVLPRLAGCATGKMKLRKNICACRWTKFLECSEAICWQKNCYPAKQGATICALTMARTKKGGPAACLAAKARRGPTHEQRMKAQQ